MLDWLALMIVAFGVAIIPLPLVVEVLEHRGTKRPARIAGVVIAVTIAAFLVAFRWLDAPRDAWLVGAAAASGFLFEAIKIEVERRRAADGKNQPGAQDPRVVASAIFLLATATACAARLRDGVDVEAFLPILATILIPVLTWTFPRWLPIVVPGLYSDGPRDP